MAKYIVHDYTDILAYAEETKLAGWNETIDLLQEAYIIPFYECATRDIYPDEIENELLRKIIEGFMEQEGIDDLTIVDN